MRTAPTGRAGHLPVSSLPRHGLLHVVGVKVCAGKKVCVGRRGRLGLDGEMGAGTKHSAPPLE
jgi:hypothetical protein